MQINPRRKRLNGFTIVELLVVITVIGILAAVTIISYSGIQQNAKTKSVMSDLTNASGTLALYYSANNQTYPNDLLTISNGGPLAASPGTNYQYHPTGTAFCLTGTNGTVSYNITDSTDVPAIGGCPGDGVAPIVNLAINPSAEVNQTGFGAPGGSTISRNTAKYSSGGTSILATMPINTASQVGASIINSYAVPATLPLNTTYMVSVYVYVPTGTVNMKLSIQGAKQTVTYGSSSSTSVKDGWVRLSNVFTTLASGSGTLTIYVLNSVATTTAGTQFWVDGVMLTQGATLYNYADGDSAGWSWSGAVENSNSTGPPL